ncbi:MAG: hypothetical protein ACJATP_002730 [Candidatus Azotimanducaceae bacterium]
MYLLAEPLSLKSLVPDNKTIALPAKNLDHVAATIAEREQRATVCRLYHRLLDDD